MVLGFCFFSDEQVLFQPILSHTVVDYDERYLCVHEIDHLFVCLSSMHGQLTGWGGGLDQIWRGAVHLPREGYRGSKLTSEVA